MTTVLERVDRAPEWGIHPVPPEHRVLNGVDVAILWGDLGIGLLVLVSGALLVPGLGFWPATAAIAVGSAIGVALLALAGAAGARHGIPTMVLFRPVLGIKGSWLPSVLNAAQLVGWTAVELWAMSYVADLVSRRVFGFSARGVWLAAAALFCTALAVWGPVGVTRVWMRRFGAWIVVGISAAVTILVLGQEGIGAAVGAAGSGEFPTFGIALDLVIAMPVSWLPLVADYNRFARGPRAALFGTFAGYLIANVWLYTLGALLVLGAHAEPSPAGIAAGVLAVTGGTIAGILFLVALLVGETDEAFADMYSGAVSLQNIVPRASQRGLIVGLAVVATALAGWLTMERYEAFLLLIGSVFVPLFGMLGADYFVNRRARIDVPGLYARTGKYASGLRVQSILPWLTGFIVYHWIAPTGPEWWIETVSSVADAPLSARFGWLSASIPSFLVAFALSLRRPVRTDAPGVRLSSERRR